MKKLTALLLALLLVCSLTLANADTIGPLVMHDDHVFVYGIPGNWDEVIAEYVYSQTDTMTDWVYALSSDGTATNMFQVEEVAQTMTEAEAKAGIEGVYNEIVGPNRYNVADSAVYEDSTNNGVNLRLYSFEFQDMLLTGVIATAPCGALSILYINTAISAEEAYNNMVDVLMSISVK